MNPEHKHEFVQAGRPYYKENGGVNMFGKTYDHSIEYQTLFCKNCGETKEIVCANHTILSPTSPTK